MSKPRNVMMLFLLMTIIFINLVVGCQISVEIENSDQGSQLGGQATVAALETDRSALATNVAKAASGTAISEPTLVIETPAVLNTPTPDHGAGKDNPDLVKPLLLTPEEVPPGLVFRSLGAIWWIDEDGLVEHLSTDDSTMIKQLISDDGTRLVYQSEDYDLWLRYLTTGELRNLTNTPDHMERLLSGVPGNLHEILITTQHEEGCRMLSAINIESGSHSPWLTGLDVFGPLAPSPDGEELAFLAQECDAEGINPTAWIYGGGWAEPFDLESYGVSVETYLVPSWSPDRMWMAWGVIFSSEPIPEEDYAGGQEIPPDPAQLGIVLLNRITEEAKILDVFEGDTSCHFGRITWSPDSQWLAYSRNCMFWEANGLRVLDVGGYKTYNFTDRFTDPVWSPDSRWLAFEEEGLMLMEVGKWVPFRIGPEYTLPIDWLSIGT